jgi:hypothetical protein
MLDPDFSKHHPAWKLAALIVDRAPSLLRSGAVLLAAYHTPGGLQWAYAWIGKGHL